MFTAKSGPIRGELMKVVAALTIAAAAALTGCGSDTGDESTATTMPSITSTPASIPASAPSAAPTAECYPAAPISDPELATFAAGLQLPPGYGW